ncbi:MAG: hypothetical protein RBR41_02280 [Desulfovibrio sp.]|uniref:hypothetical protein n=1 Tax=Desulfovibrio sp. TaxID=885 RepID=UPI002A36619E|nr:hypothetical protein [Desulfovibrio sp.]MDY0258478.1 hypothetical protein [Desulfovibrio sp.]
MTQTAVTSEPTPEAQKIAFNTKYSTTLDAVLRSALDDYNQTTYTIKRFQHSTIKSYLWIATVVFAAELAFFADIASTKQLIAFIDLTVDVQSKVFKFFSCLSLILSLVVFLLGVDTMRGRGKGVGPTVFPWTKIGDLAFDDCDEFYTDSCRITLIRDIQEAITQHVAESNSIGVKLRCMSWGVLASVGTALVTLLC